MGQERGLILICHFLNDIQTSEFFLTREGEMIRVLKKKVLYAKPVLY